MASSSIDANVLSSGSTSVPSVSVNAGTPYPAQALAALETYKKKDSSKVVVRFKAIGNAPIMKNNYFRITAFNRFQAVIQFLRKELGWKQGDALVHRLSRIASMLVLTNIALQFLYINSSFSPAPDDSVGNLFRVCIRHFLSRGKFADPHSHAVLWNRRPSHSQLLDAGCLGLKVYTITVQLQMDSLYHDFLCHICS